MDHGLQNMSQALWEEEIGEKAPDYPFRFGEGINPQHVVVSEPLPDVFQNGAMLFYVSSGQGTLMVNGMEFPVGAGSFGWLHAYHIFRFEPGWSGELKLYACTFDYASASYVTYRESLTVTRKVFFECAPVMRLTGKEDEKISRLFEEFCEEYGGVNQSGDLMQCACFLELSSYFLRFGNKLAETGGTYERNLVWKLLQHIFTYSNENLTQEKLAAFYGESGRSVSCCLRLATGQSFSDLLNRARVTRACEMLVYSGLTMRNIVYYTGFHSETAFYQAFKRHRNMTPQEYRDERIQKAREDGREIIDGTALSVLNYLFAHYREALTIQDAARTLYLEKNAVNPLLESNFGQDFKHIVTGLRMTYARSLILEGRFPAADVACACGYSNPHTFIRIFKEWYGMTPGVYKKEGGL